MDNLIPKSYKNYGNYVNSSRAFTLDIDGLKPVERRVLLTAHQVAREKLVKSARVDGNCIAKYHPHGTSYGTIVQMVKNGFLIGQGNYGNNLGVEPSPPAAMRYTECRMSPFTEQLAFKYIKHVPWQESELDDEPLFLPTMYPMCFLGTEYTQGIGFGFRTYIPCYTVSDLQKRLKWKLGIRKSKPTIAPISDCEIIATNADLELLLTTGKATIGVKGKVIASQPHCKVRLKSWPPGRRFQSILGKFKKELEIGDIGYMDLSNDEVGTAIEFTVLKQRNRDKIFTAFVKKLKTAVTGTISFEINTVDVKQNVRVSAIDDMLVNTYNLYKQVNEARMKHEQGTISEKVNELKQLELLKKPLASILQTGSKLVDNDIKQLSVQSTVPEEAVRALISKHNIKKLLTLSTDTKELVDRNTQLVDDLKNLDAVTIGEYTALK